MSRISPDDLLRIFRNLDKNNDGEVSIHELHHLLDRLGIQTALEELEEFVGRTSLDYADFEKMLGSILAEREPNPGNGYDTDLLEAFKVFDLNGDGYISGEELQNVLSRLGLWEKRNGHDGKDLIGVYDENSDGVLDFQEFKNMMSGNSRVSESEM